MKKMKIKLHPGSSQEKIEKISEAPEAYPEKSSKKIFTKGDYYEVWLKEKPIDNKANNALEKFLKKYFGKPVKIVSGFTSKIKKVELVSRT